MQTKRTTTAKLYIGIDIHKRSWKIHTSTDLFDGKSFSMEPNSNQLKKYVEKYYPQHSVSCAYEAGCCGYKPYRDFMGFGWETLVVNPADISKTGKAQYQKTDKIDARLICRELKDNRLKSIEIPDIKREQLRCLFRRRNDLVKDYRKIKSKILMQLLYLGIEIPNKFDNPNWSHSFRNWIGSLNFDYQTLTVTLKSYMSQFDFIDQQVRMVSNQLRKYCRKEYKEDYYLLRSIPGIGGIVACGILSELGDLRRFNHFKQFASYVGLCPSMHQSGDKSTTSGLTIRSHRLMRSYFVEASWQALRFDPIMQEYYRKHKGKDVKKVLIKVARKLLSRTFAVIKTKTPYQAGVVV